MKQVNKWLTYADNALSENKIISNGKIDETFKGYVSSLGAMIIQNGLPASIAINLKTDSDGKERIKIIDAVTYILGKSGKKPESYSPTELLRESCRLERENNLRELRILKQDVIDASIAIKLIMRTYEFVKS